MISLKSPWKTTKNDMQHDFVDICLSRTRMDLILLEQIPNAFLVPKHLPKISLTSLQVAKRYWKLNTEFVY